MALSWHLIGLAVGDALGDIGRNDAYRGRFGIITNLYADARSTDDTEFAVLIARILTDCQGDLTPKVLLGVLAETHPRSGRRVRARLPAKLLLFDSNLTRAQAILYYTLEANRDA